LLGGLAAILAAGRSIAAPATMTAPITPAAVGAIPFPNGVTILIAGPEGGRLGRWGDTVGAALGDALPQGTKVHTSCIGGLDGVTGANQFDARVPPDGSTMLLTPGAAATDWLAGDPRVHFDAGHWVPVMAGVAPAVVLVRPDLLPLTTGKPVRIAASGPVGPQLPALLGFDLLGAHLVPVFDLVEQSAAIAAFAAGKVDAVLACGPDVPNQVMRVQAAGGRTLFALGTSRGAGAPARDETFAEVPTLLELHQTLYGSVPRGPRYEAYRAAAAATQLEFGLVLPQLTSAAMVALWRRTASQAATEPSVQALAAEAAVQPLEGVAAATATTGVTADTSALLDLRGWLATRFNWHPT
jgi:hypothetical protein